MRIQLKEADIYSILTDYFETFPFNDFAQQKVFTILAMALNGRYKKPRPEMDIKVANIQIVKLTEDLCLDDETKHMEN